MAKEFLHHFQYVINLYVDGADFDLDRNPFIDPFVRVMNGTGVDHINALDSYRMTLVSPSGALLGDWGWLIKKGAITMAATPPQHLLDPLGGECDCAACARLLM